MKREEVATGQEYFSKELLTELTSSQAPSYASPKLWITYSLTGVRCRATSVAKKLYDNVNIVHWTTPARNYQKLKTSLIQLESFFAKNWIVEKSCTYHVWVIAARPSVGWPDAINRQWALRGGGHAAIPRHAGVEFFLVTNSNLNWTRALERLLLHCRQHKVIYL